jgi:2-dehydropantoate 2-reductase
MRMALIGTGSLGIVIGGLLAKAGIDVELITPHAEAAAILNSQGAVLRGAIEAVIPVKARTPDQMRGVYDFVLLLTKLDATPQALAELSGHLHDKSLVCTLQNGMPEEMVAAEVGAQRTAGGVVLIGAARQGPNVSHITCSAKVLEEAFEIGELDGRTTPRIAILAEALSAVGGCRVVPDLLDIRWAKLLVNAAGGAMTAMLGCICERVLAHPEALAFAVRIADETIRTAHACGRRLARLHGSNLERLALAPGETPENKFEIFREFFGPYAATKSSMLQDLEQGRSTEVRRLNGYVSAKGRELGLATPCNDILTRLVIEAEARGKAPDFAENLTRALGQLRG